VAAALTVAIALSGCATKQQNGALAGAAAGAAIGATVKGKAKPYAILAGAVIGALVGGSIGKAMDDADAQKAAEAAQQAAAGGSTVQWSSDKNPNVGGYAEPITPVYEQKTVRCLNSKLNIPYQSENGQCWGQDRQLSDGEYAEPERRQTESTSAPSPSTTETIPPTRSCRKVREVMLVNGNEQKDEVQYCLAGSQWVRG
jgi:surface antigen